MLSDKNQITLFNMWYLLENLIQINSLAQQLYEIRKPKPPIEL